MKKKTQDRSPVVLLEEIFPSDTNPYGTAFGGKILALMDRAAGLAASRFAHAHFVTASLEAIEFRAPVRQGEIAEIVAQVVYTSRHTCGIQVEVFAVDKTQWRRIPCCHGLLFMVAIDTDGKPAPVHEWTPKSRKEKQDWRKAQAVHISMLGRKKLKPK